MEYNNQPEKSTFMQHASPEENTSSIVYNVGGTRFKLNRSDLEQHSDGYQTSRALLAPYYQARNDEYYFDRNPKGFQAIMDYYQTGTLHLPQDMCGVEFKGELDFWGVDDGHMSDCCWLQYSRDVASVYKKVTSPSVPQPTQSTLASNAWMILENTHPRCLTKIYPIVSCCVIVLMIIILSVDTMPVFKHYGLSMQGAPIFYTLFFAAEFILRIIFCPSKCSLFKQPINYLDFVTVASCIIHFALINGSILVCIISLRVLRVLWFMRHFKIGQGIGHTLWHHSRDILVVIIAVHAVGLVFSTTFYFIEGRRWTAEGHVQGIFDGFYFSMMTLTTVGYGDMRPIGRFGKLMGSLCSICGVFFLGCMGTVIYRGIMGYFIEGKYRQQKNLSEMKTSPTVPLPQQSPPASNEAEATVILASNGHSTEVGKENLRRLPGSKLANFEIFSKFDAKKKKVPTATLR